MRRITSAWSSPRGGSVLADIKVQGRPSASDLAALLTKAMRLPLNKGAHRPRPIHVRGHHKWQELFPHLVDLGIKVAVTQELPKVRAAYEDRLRQMQEARRAKMVKPTKGQAQVKSYSLPSLIGYGMATLRSVTRKGSDLWRWPWTTEGSSMKTTGPARWPRRWRFWTKELESGLSKGSNSNHEIPVGTVLTFRIRPIPGQKHSVTWCEIWDKS